MSYIDILMSRGRQGTLFDQLAYRKMVGGGGGTLIGTDDEPYQYRRSPSLGAYTKERDEVVGVSVGWNQLVNTTDTSVTVPSGHKYIARINGTWSVGTSSGTALTVDGSNNDMVIDLTQMLGSTIADYIVTQGNTNGVAFFRKYFGKDYYAYDSGSIRSVEGLQAHIMRDAEDNIIGNYPLDSTVTLRGKFDLVDGKLKADGDTYEANGTVTRKTWVCSADSANTPALSGGGVWYVDISKPADYREGADEQIVCNCYSQIATSATGTSGTIKNYNTAFTVYDDGLANMTMEQARAYLNNKGFEVVAERPISQYATETATPYAKTQKVDPSGTEEYVTSSVVPIGHNTEYYG